MYGVSCCFTNYNVCCDYFGVLIEKHVYTKFCLNWYCVSELHAHLCPDHNVWPEVVVNRVCLCVILSTLYALTHLSAGSKRGTNGL